MNQYDPCIPLKERSLEHLQDTLARVTKSIAKYKNAAKWGNVEAKEKIKGFRHLKKEVEALIQKKKEQAA